MAITWSKKSFIRGRSAAIIGAKETYCALGPQQPLLLERDIANPNDMNAVLVKDLFGTPCGYIAREHALEVSAKIAAGEIVLARTNGPCMCIYRFVYLWIEGEEKQEVRKRELVLTNDDYPPPPGRDQYGSVE